MLSNKCYLYVSEKVGVSGWTLDFLISNNRMLTLLYYITEANAMWLWTGQIGPQEQTPWEITRDVQCFMSKYLQN